MSKLRIDFKVSGLDRVVANLERIGEQMVTRAEAALYQEAELIMTTAKERTPIKTGALRSSGHVKAPTRTRSQVSVRLGFGGTAAPYAIAVHENLNAYHRVGRAKFLESAIVDALPTLAPKIMLRVRSFG